MPDYLVVLVKIGAMFLVMLIGWLARRADYLDAVLTARLGRLAVDIAFPCLVFTQMLRTVDTTVLRHGAVLLLLALIMLISAAVMGAAILPFFFPRRRRGTALFLAALPNWIFLPLPIAAALFGNDGIRDVLLFNVSAQLLLWSVGVWTLQGSAPDWRALVRVLRNPGLLATAAGIGLAVVYPPARAFLTDTAQGGHFSPLMAAAAALQAMEMIGSLTIPLSLLVTGAQLGALTWRGDGARGELPAVLFVRLAAAPLGFAILLRWGSGWLAGVPASTRLTCCLISAMPVAISATVMADRYGGDAALSARAIFWSTLASMLTVPFFFWLVRQLGV